MLDDDVGRFSAKDVVVGVCSDGIAVVAVGVCGGYTSGVTDSGVTDDGVGYELLLGYGGVLSDAVDVGVEVGMP